VFIETRRVIGAALEHSLPPTVNIGSGSSPVTRDQVVAEMDREYEALRPQIKFTPNPAPIDPDMLRISASVKPKLIKLIKLGFIGRVAPLATGPKASLEPAEFGDAIGFFITRMAQLTHMPSPKWSPLLGMTDN
jgi:hypothetical protein